jgi:holo-[acyl-carrier protein] synthase
MSFECGVDIVEVDRIKDSIEKYGESFLKKVFTDKEVEYCESRKVSKYQSYAARFAAKEAVSKAFGTGIGADVSLNEIEIAKDEKGKPYVILSGNAKEFFRKMKGEKISISLSHTRQNAIAYVIIEKDI